MSDALVNVLEEFTQSLGSFQESLAPETAKALGILPEKQAWFDLLRYS